jgi:hypothetical protein
MTSARPVGSSHASGNFFATNIPTVAGRGDRPARPGSVDRCWGGEIRAAMVGAAFVVGPDENRFTLTVGDEAHYGFG